MNPTLAPSNNPGEKIESPNNLFFIAMFLVIRRVYCSAFPSLGLSGIQRRYLSLHEYQSMFLFEKYNVDHARGSLCTNPNDAKSIWETHATKEGSPMPPTDII